MAEAKLREAVEAIAAARVAKGDAFQDKAGDALALCRRACLQCRTSPELLDKMQDQTEMADTLDFLLRSCESKASRKGQVRECLKVLLARPPWLIAARADEEKKIALIDFLKASPDMEDVVAALESEEGPAAAAEPATEASAKAVVPSEGDAGSADELTRRLLTAGLEIMKEVDFAYPTGVHSEEKSDRALEGFTAFYKGTTRLRDGGLEDIPDVEMPRILNFLATTYKARRTHQAKVLFIVNKLTDVSHCFQKLIEENSLDFSEARLPWLPTPSVPPATSEPAVAPPAAPPAAAAVTPAAAHPAAAPPAAAPSAAPEPAAVASAPGAPAAAAAAGGGGAAAAEKSADASAAGYPPVASFSSAVEGPPVASLPVGTLPIRPLPVASEEIGILPTRPLPVAAKEGPLPVRGIPVMSVLVPDAKKTVVWLDGRPDSYQKATVLKDAGLNVVGFHDDWSTGESRAAEAALTYIVNAISSPDESISAVVVNNGPTHKQMLKDVRRFCASQKRDLPFFAACTMRGTPADFVHCGVSVINRDRAVIQNAIVEHVNKTR